MGSNYYTPPGGMPAQNEDIEDRAVFTTAYAFMPKRVLTDIVASSLPRWDKTRLWVVARPMTGFAETFSHYIMDLQPGGGSSDPEEDPEAEHVLFATSGEASLEAGGATHALEPGSYAYIPAGTGWGLRAGEGFGFHWFRKRYVPARGVPQPRLLVTSDAETEPVAMPGTNGAWATSRFVDPGDLAHDMHVNIVSLEPGACIPFAETHVMEHGIYVLQGEGRYRLNEDWFDVEAGDYMWLRAFCPQRCIAGGSEPFRYLLYRDANRHMPLDPPAANIDRIPAG